MSVVQNEMLDSFKQPSFWRRRTLFDWLWAALVIAGSVYTHQVYGQYMNGYEVGILYASAAGLIGLGWLWPAMRLFSLVVTAISLFAVWRYGVKLPGLPEGLTGQAALNALAGADQEHYDFFFKYLVSSQAATMWMCALYIMATVTYFLALAVRSEFSGKVASAMTWSATVMGTVGLLVRWRESYLIAHEVGHIPVSNLYEVFILFAIITALIYLYYEGRYRTRAMGGFVLLIISAAVAFLLWYHFDRQAHEIAPLIPALQSWWMKIHVPANFVGYGAFALAAMLGVAYLIRARKPADAPSRLPSLDVLDDVMYKSIALGFAFFTVATILGAMWAAEAWGKYWSWDPKEVWALIVWLNYAAWLHLRLTKGWRGVPMAWWAIAGLFVTTFAFLGVNMFLSGLHSYGEL